MQIISTKHIHLIAPDGERTPEYAVLLQSLVEISKKIAAEEEDFSRSLLSASVISSRKSTHDLMTMVLNEVAGNALKFYALLQVLDERNFRDRYSSVLKQLERNFLGKFFSFLCMHMYSKQVQIRCCNNSKIKLIFLHR